MGVVLNWSSVYTPVLGSPIDSFPTVSDGVHDVLASHVNSLATSLVAVETLQQAHATTLAGLAIDTRHELVGGTNTLIDVVDTEVVLGGFVLDPSEYGFTTVSFTLTALVTLYSSVANGRVRLYDLGAPGTPIVPVLRATVSTAVDSAPQYLTQVLTTSATPGVGVNEVRSTASMYELRMIVDGGDPGDSLHTFSAGVRIDAAT